MTTADASTMIGVMGLFAFLNREEPPETTQERSPGELLDAIIQSSKDAAERKHEVHDRMVERGADYEVASAEVANVAATEEPEAA
ncbi:MAG TPA: hypothetical protein VGW10_18950 [Solirubrobacteraceae bacterium]|nr:hypothetical protein [Solirubrobacteraceae bacterium]